MMHWRKTILGVLAATVAASTIDAMPAVARPFTIAVIPDTQNYIDYTHQTAEGYPFDANRMFLDQMAYIASRTEKTGGDVAFVSGLGDIWQHQTALIDPDHARRGFKRAANPLLDSHFAPTSKVTTIELPTALKGYQMIANTVPFSVVPGNHDHDAMWTDSNHPPAAHPKDMSEWGMLHAGGLNNFNSVFGADSAFFKGKSWYVASHNGGANSAQIFTAGGYSFLHIGLQFDAPNDALVWAASVIKRYPGLPTIVSTHDFLDTQGRRLANPMIDNSVLDPEDNSPQMIWDKFIAKNDQIFLVLCGHEHAQAFRVDDNNAGHKVYQVLSDYQDRRQTAKDAGMKTGTFDGIGDGWMRFMTFDMDAAVPTVSVDTYSTHYKKHAAEAEHYADWYKAEEKPQLSDAEFVKQDVFAFDLTDFRSRFGRPKGQ